MTNNRIRASWNHVHLWYPPTCHYTPFVLPHLPLCPLPLSVPFFWKVQLNYQMMTCKTQTFIVQSQLYCLIEAQNKILALTMTRQIKYKRASRATQLIGIWSKSQYHLLQFLNCREAQYSWKVSQNTITFKYCWAAESSWPAHHTLQT